MNNKLSIFLLALLSVCFFSSAQAQTPVVTGVGTAVIDGVLNSGEWSGAGVVDFFIDVRYASAVVPTHLYVMNDATTLYLAIKVDGQTALGWRDTARFVLDRNGSSLLDAGDDILRGESAIYPPTGGYFSTFQDLYAPCNSCESLDSADGGSNDGAAVVTNNGNETIFEIAHPLNSADDAHDMSVLVNQTITLLGGEIGLYANPQALKASGALPTVQILISPTVQAISIDVRPHTPNNVISLSGEPFPVVILSAAQFDATTIAFPTIRFGHSGTEAAPTELNIRDVNRDGLLDVVVKFRPSQTGLLLTDTIAYLTAQTKTGQSVIGQDVVKIKQ